jgi:hypothetical protein
MNPLLWLIRAKRRARHPPSSRQVRLLLITIGLCLLIVAVEALVGWPDALTLNPRGLQP